MRQARPRAPQAAVSPGMARLDVSFDYTP